MIHKAKKSLGQNFLKSKAALSAMCKAGDVGSADTVLEIGPGKGALTEYLLKQAYKVVAVEKDHELCTLLSEKFGKEVADGKLTLIQGDILTFNPSLYDLKPFKYKVIANIPYNITGAIFKKFLTESTQPERMVLLVQKEVAERVITRDGKESILSISVKAYGEPKYIMKVSKRFFSPAPKVDSAILQITNISRANFKNREQESRFFDILKAGFAHKRKVLKKNLSSVLDKNTINNIYSEFNIPENTRAENLSTDMWLKINNFPHQ